MITMFLANPWRYNVEEVQVERMTEHNVWVKGFMQKRSPVDGFGYYDTYDEAFKFLSDKINGDIRSHESKLEESKDKMRLLMMDMIKRVDGDKNDTYQAI